MKLPEKIKLQMSESGDVYLSREAAKINEIIDHLALHDKRVK